jgi:predicted metal-dependent phosphoesterase TrpH
MVTNFTDRTAGIPVTATDAVELRKVLGQVDAHSCPQFYNFHMHTLYSDGRLEPELLMQQAVDIGLLGMAITDHHSTRGYKFAQKWLLNFQAQPDAPLAAQNLHLWTGVEITACLLDTEVHILGYAFDPHAASLESYLHGRSPKGDLRQASRVIDAIHQAGGLAVLAHPARYHRSATDLIPAAANLGIDGVETYYAYKNPTPWEPSVKQTAEVQKLARIYGLLDTCGTDTHGTNLLQRL